MPIQILRNQSMLQKMSQNLANLEMSDIARVLNTPSIFVTWYSIVTSVTEIIPGFRNVDDYIHPASTVIYDRIENCPMFGIDNLLEYSQYDTEIARFDEDFSSSGVVYPNTVFPKPGDCFVLENSTAPALYVVTDIHPSTVKSNPFIEVNFRLFSRDVKTIELLNQHQVRNEYVTSASSLGNHTALVVDKKTQNDLEAHVNAYLDIAALYGMLFYDRNIGSFVYDGLPGPGTQGVIARCKYVDMTLWRFMFDEGIIIFDDLVTFAANNYGRNIERMYTSSPDLYIEDHSFHRSILWRLYEGKDSNSPVLRRESFDEYRYPQVWRPTSRITKYQGVDIWYLENYDNKPWKGDPFGDFYLWDDEFLHKIRQNELYEEIPIKTGICTECELHCMGTPVMCYNPYLRNVVINYFNGEEIDWDNIQISDQRTIENYYLLPLVLGIYKKYIQNLQ